jgi:hypothetical protein
VVTTMNILVHRLATMKTSPPLIYHNPLSVPNVTTGSHLTTFASDKRFPLVYRNPKGVNKIPSLKSLQVVPSVRCLDQQSIYHTNQMHSNTHMHVLHIKL